MKSCRGCVHYMTNSNGGLCRYYQNNGTYTTTVNRFDGKTYKVWQKAPAPPGFESSLPHWIETMRAEGAPCGPEARLREGGFREWLFGPWVNS